MTAAMKVPASDLRERIAALPGADRLLPALEGLAPAYLVGGAVRDLLRGASSVDLDVVVEGDALGFARTLAERLRGEAVFHARFGTATVRADGLAVDLARARRELYRQPGALPEVEPAALEDDLARRDFTINAMAAALSGDQRGALRDPHGGLDDLRAGRVRVLHDRSFSDDPTRLLRGIRYEARLGYALEPDTEAWAREAVRLGALRTVSGPRLREELLRLLGEVEAPAALERMRELGVDRALHPALRTAAEPAASAMLGALETGADRVLAALAALVHPAASALEQWLDGLGFDAERRTRVVRAGRSAPDLVSLLRVPRSPSELHRLLHGEPPEALALAMALGAPPEPILRYLHELSGVRLEVTGDDLVAAGIPPSPVIGRALRETLRRKLDGEVSGRRQELELAIALAAEDAGEDDAAGKDAGNEEHAGEDAAEEGTRDGD